MSTSYLNHYQQCCIAVSGLHEKIYIFTNLLRTQKLKRTSRFTDEAEPDGDDEDSDAEDDDMDAVNGQQAEMEPEDHDQSFLTGVLESLMEKCSVLKTRSGRAGLVHNFLRGLQLMAAPVLSGEPRLLLVCLIVCLFVGLLFVYFCVHSQAQHRCSQNQNLSIRRSFKYFVLQRWQIKNVDLSANLSSFCLYNRLLISPLL